jgi:hypothetical protein
MKKQRIVILGLTLVIFVLTVARVVVANGISTNGVVLADISEKNEKVSRENMLLKERLYKLSSLTHISSEAARLGFVTKTEYISLNSPLPLAHR